MLLGHNHKHLLSQTFLSLSMQTVYCQEEEERGAQDVPQKLFLGSLTFSSNLQDKTVTVQGEAYGLDMCIFY